jgi:23S rRNA (uridine2552-2'-O)-methyltransferase
MGLLLSSIYYIYLLYIVANHFHLKHQIVVRSRSSSSRRWLQRQINDQFVQASKKEGYRSRAAFKLLEIDAKYKLLQRGVKILELGSVPGGWSQVIIARVGVGNLFALDLVPMIPLTGVNFLKLDFICEDAGEKILHWMNGAADVIVSDMAPSMTGNRTTDHLRSTLLADRIVEVIITQQLLCSTGSLVFKFFHCGHEKELKTLLHRYFLTVRFFKPQASHRDSAEIYVIAQNYCPNSVILVN